MSFHWIIICRTTPDVSVIENGYPNAHAMVLGALLGRGDPTLQSLMKANAFASEDLLYIGLQNLHDYQKAFLDEARVDYEVQTEHFVSHEKIDAFLARYDHILVHLDIDVLDAKRFHATYFASPELVGDGSGSGKMTLPELSQTLQRIFASKKIEGFTIAEYLPFEAQSLHSMFSQLPLLTD